MDATREKGLTVDELYSLPSGTLVESVNGGLALTCDRPGLIMLNAELEGKGGVTLLEARKCFDDGEWHALPPGARVTLTQDARADPQKD